MASRDAGGGARVNIYQELRALGLSAFPVSDGSGKTAAKRPLVAWKLYQTGLPSEAECKQFGNFSGAWVGVACGAVSGGLEVLDFDIPGKKGDAPPAFEPWREFLEEHGFGDLLARLVMYRTGSGGVQVAYRHKGTPAGNQKLAMRHKDVLIETRGQGGYVVCPPSKGYQFLQGSFQSLPVLTDSERSALIDAARLFDERMEDTAPVAEIVTMEGGGLRPGDDYDQRATWEEVLEPHGWHRAGFGRGQKQMWRRPGKPAREGASAIADTHLFVWSTNAGLPTERQLSKFAVYAHLSHAGDYGKAASELARQGYGEKRAPRSSRQSAPRAETSGALARSVPAASQAREYNRTDAGHAARIVDTYGEILRYCHAWGKWLVWDGKRWVSDEKGESVVVDLALKLVPLMMEEADALEDEERKKATGWAMRCESATQIRNSLSLVKTDPRIAVSPNELDSHPYLVNCENGVFDLQTGEMRAHDPLLLQTRQCNASFDADAVFDQWESFLARVLPSEELQRFVYKAVGYSLTGSTREQVFFFLYGALGANGKSTFVEVVSEILGGYMRAMQPETLMLQPTGRQGASSDIARLKGARFVSAPETPAGRRLDEQLVKQLTGGDRVVARYLYQSEFEFVPELKLWITGNHKPTISGTDAAIWRRVRLVPFNVQIPPSERDPDLKAKLLAERDGIFRWMLMGALDWMQSGLTAPPEVLEAAKEYQEEMDTLGRFLSEKCERGATYEIQSGILYNTYKDWCLAEGIAKPWTQTSFSLALRERGIEKARTNQYKVFRGVRLAWGGDE